jgi:hypothetical protein
MEAAYDDLLKQLLVGTTLTGCLALFCMKYAYSSCWRCMNLPESRPTAM